MSAQARCRFQGLWRHPDFLKLWFGQSVSVFGSLITRVALPILAVLALHANAAQVALIYAAQVAPTIALGLAAGALADRVRRRPLLIAADIGRALTLASIPVAAVVGTLDLNLVYVVTLLTSALTAIFDIAYPAYLPSLVGHDALLEGNAKLGASMSVSEVAAFGVGGALVQAFTAPGAILVDIVTYLVSIVSLALIHAREPQAPRLRGPEHPLRQLRGDIAHGARLAFLQPTRRALAGMNLTQALGGGMLETAFYIFVLRDLHIAPAIATLTFSVGGVASFIAATQSERVARWLGMRRTLRVSALLGVLFTLLIPLAGGPLWLAITCLVGTQLGDAASTVYEIAQTTTLQRISPSGALGRITASIQFVGGLANVLGLALGAALGQTLGARATLYIAVLCMLLGPLWLLLERLAPDEGITGEEEAEPERAIGLR